MAAPKLSQQLTFIYGWFCPYAQRTWIALNEKGIPYTAHAISVEDLYGKPEWFKKLNPKGQVPVLAWCEGSEVRTVYESLICNEFLEDAHPKPPLMPADAYSRARSRLLVERFNTSAVATFYKLLMQQDAGVQADCCRTLDVELRWLQEQMHPEGPYLFGPQFTSADAVVLPWLFRLPVLTHYRGYSYPEDCGRLRAYVEAAGQRPAVAATLVHPDGKDYMEAMIEIYANYANGTATSQVAQQAKK